MSCFDMFGVLIVCAVLLSATDVAHGKYRFYPKMNGWARVHKVMSTWKDAFQQCEAEDGFLPPASRHGIRRTEVVERLFAATKGTFIIIAIGAVLMSPVREELLSTMLSLSEDGTSYFIGTKARFLSGLYVSLEGVPLEDMPATYMFSQLDPQLGDCLSMDRDQIRVVSCETRLPYMCYKEHRAGQNVTECGTFDKEYKFANSTGSCYKFHTVKKEWVDAYATCTAEGGYLAVVNDLAEAKTLVDIFHNKGYYVWVGLRDWNGHGSWTSVHGESLQQIYNTWETDTVPANSCCEIGGIHPTTGQLNSFGSSETSHFVCEKDPNYVTFPSEE